MLELLIKGRRGAIKLSLQYSTSTINLVEDLAMCDSIYTQFRRKCSYSSASKRQDSSDEKTRTMTTTPTGTSSRSSPEMPS